MFGAVLLMPPTDPVTSSSRFDVFAAIRIYNIYQ
jgi:hypothetical protein